MITSTSNTSPSMPELQREGAAGLLARVVVGVSDPDATAQFMHDGLDFSVKQIDDSWLVMCAGEYGSGGQGALELRRSTSLELLDIVFATPPGFDTASVPLSFGGVRTRSGGLRLTDPSGISVSLEPSDNLAVEPPTASSLRPRRLGHLNANAPNPGRTAQFYTEVMGLALSEQIGENLYFLRTHTEHHNVGLRPGAQGGLHHLGFEVAGWHAYQPILDHLDSMGYKAEYGPGRHRPGLSYFTYVRDPSSGLRLELFADMSHINTGHDTEPIVWDAEDRMTKTINCWGPTPPESFFE